MFKVDYLKYFLVCWLALHWGAALAADRNWWLDIRNDRDAAVARQLRQGTDPNVRNERGEPALMQAVREDSWKVFDVILADPRTDVNILNGLQETPLMYTALQGDLARSRQLVARGAQVNKLGWTPLHYAAAKGQAEVAAYLIEQGAIVNAPAPDGTSPLMMAMRANSAETARLLIEAGADPGQRNLQGEDAISMARQHGNTRLAEALERLVQSRRAQGRH
ncbi:ankyrin repeat domain-containing protein [Orrella sp. JC864]|uniref:ankyrin repeat domain-containing protein n=1 Tax=Orrella sp. JC864 TaxID=3120298 RepID=UPI00300911F0